MWARPRAAPPPSATPIVRRVPGGWICWLGGVGVVCAGGGSSDSGSEAAATACAATGDAGGATSSCAVMSAAVAATIAAATDRTWTNASFIELSVAGL